MHIEFYDHAAVVNFLATPVLLSLPAAYQVVVYDLHAVRAHRNVLLEAPFFPPEYKQYSWLNIFERLLGRLKFLAKC